MLLLNQNRRTVKAPVNALDKCTIFSIYPARIDEFNPTIQPGRFVIEPGTYEKPSRLVVGPSSWWKEVEENQPLLEIPTSSVLIAESIINDYSNGLLACNMIDAMPGLFFVLGEMTLPELLVKNKPTLDRALKNQKNWFSILVNIGDSLWARSNGNPLAISDNMRMAARDLGLDSKEWLQDFHVQAMIKCVACGNMRNPLYPICPSCHNVIDPELYKKLGITTAEKK